MSEKQPEALMLADVLDIARRPQEGRAAAELRRQHARIAELEGQRNELVDSVCGLENKVAGLELLLREAGVKNAELEAQLESVGAGGASALMPARADRKPLTNEQIEEMRFQANRGFNIEAEDYTKAVRDAEAAHNITGEKP